MLIRSLASAVFVLLAAVAVQAQDRPVRLHAPPDLVETGLMQHILPRFTLKTRVRVEIVAEPARADLVLGDEGRALFEGAGQVWRMAVRSRDHPGTERFADWLASEVGRNTVASFAPAGEALFAPRAVSRETAVAAFDGDATLGREVSRVKCARCHAVDDATRMSSIGSSPSFAVIRGLPDWEGRFATFYVLKPHPAFTMIEGVTPPFPENRPPPMVPLTMTADEVDAVLAYVAAMDPADLGAPLQHQ